MEHDHVHLDMHIPDVGYHFVIKVEIISSDCGVGRRQRVAGLWSEQKCTGVTHFLPEGDLGPLCAAS